MHCLLVRLLCATKYSPLYQKMEFAQCEDRRCLAHPLRQARQRQVMDGGDGIIHAAAEARLLLFAVMRR